ncbi:MAG: exodeoxyribonuclease VII large subunit [Anaerolineales bacterium]|nr:MAG: exodeoxyribonuclease VII large subunit [Anaerolineales bacterium]
MPFFEPPSWTVTDVTRYLRNLLSGDEHLQDLWVMGEVSNLSRPASGHLYFTLKDANASLRCVMWRNTVIRQQVLPRDGEAVEVHGGVDIYEAGGQYQLYADLIRPAGEGLLYQEFLRLKARLEAEGLFEAERKRPIPKWPRRIGIVTSPTGAALRDMLNTIQRRFALVEVILAPSAVQGTEAPVNIVAALENLNQVTKPDVILLARGGGSMEDLWAFNDEGVVRAIVASMAPVITGVGHETDFTIADFAADLRAATPTAAAELATPNRVDLLALLFELSERIRRSAGANVQDLKWNLAELTNRLKLRSPEMRWLSDRQRLDDLARRASIAWINRLKVENLRLEGASQRLDSLNPEAILERGYAIVTHQDGQLVRSIKDVSPGDDLEVRVSDGQFNAQALENLEN